MSRDELCDTLENKFSIHLEKGQLEDLFFVLDADGDQNIPVEQFVSFISSSRQSAMKHEDPDAALRDHAMSPEELFTRPGLAQSRSPQPGL